MFNVENAIQNWKRQLRANPAFEDGDIAELESHLRDEIKRLKAAGIDEKEAFQQAVDEIGLSEDIGDELFKTRSVSVDATPSWKQHSWVLTLLPSYVKVARRNLINNKLYSGINILGLSIGIVCCLLIYLFITNELNYDKFHVNGDRIYRVIRIMDAENDPRKVGITSAPFRDALLNDFPGLIDEAVRLMPTDGPVVTIDDRDFKENRFFIADAEFFQVFSWPLVEGNPETVLSRPGTVVISISTAEKYFGSGSAVGQTVMVDGETEFEITGVFRRPENANSHVEFDLLASMETFREANFYSGWWWNTLHTYVMLPEGLNPDRLESQLSGFMEKYFGENMAENNRKIDLELQPLEKIYFAGDTTYDWKVSHGSTKIIQMFGVIAVLVIIVASVNFVNMATARSVNRAKEIGIRKTLGAQRLNLMSQFLGEALLMTFISGLIAAGAIYSMLPWFEQLIGKQVAVNLFSYDIVVTILLFLVGIGLMAGFYPAVLLSSYKPVKALKEKISFGTSQLVIRKGLILFQFTISSLLVIGTIIVNEQLDYISKKSLGFQPDQLLNITINNDEIEPHLETFQRKLESLPGVEISSVMSGTPGGYFDNNRFRVGGYLNETYVMKTLFTDDNFTEVLELDMLAGRDFDRSFSTDPDQAVIINEAAADKFGWTPDEALGKQFVNQFMDTTRREVIGVVENFHIESLHESIAPLVVSMYPDRREILVKLKTADVTETLRSIEEVWSEFSSGYPIEYNFLSQQFAQLYENDKRQRAVFTAFSIVGIFIACMGLFSLAAFNAERRRKEMGVRKVLGATFSDIMILFNREILIIVFIAFILAVPGTYLLAEGWLQNYAYRIPNGVSNYLLAGLMIVVLSVLTVSYQSLKMATMNPVNSLRDE